MTEPYTYRSVSRKNVGMDTFTSNLVWTVRKNEENERKNGERERKERSGRLKALKINHKV